MFPRVVSHVIFCVSRFFFFEKVKSAAARFRVAQAERGVTLAELWRIVSAGQLPGTERLLAELAAISGERVRVEVEQVDEIIHDGSFQL